MKSTLKVLLACLAVAPALFPSGQALAQVSIDPDEPAVVIYEGRNFEGRSGRIVVEMGSGSSFREETYNLESFANRVSSLTIADGFEVRLYDAETRRWSTPITSSGTLTNFDNRADRLRLIKQ